MSELEIKLRVSGRSVPIRYSEAGLEWAAGQIAALLPQRSRLFVVADSTVAMLYEKAFSDALRQHAFRVVTSTFEPGEENKNLRTASRLIDKMAEEKIARDEVVIGLGGGVSTDIAGFVAAVYQRGIRWIAVPTTLMGMVDAAIGGKTGVDHPLGKNLIGAFHQPEAVFSSFPVLETLDRRDWTSGSAEVVKTALLSGGNLWDKVSQLGPDLYSWPRVEVFDAIVAAAQVKINVVSQDEKERDQRRLLNLGHTFGHALEAATRFEVFRHGEALFLGLRAAIALSHAQGLLSVPDSTRLDDLLAPVELPRATVKSDTLVELIGHDKKAREERLHWVLLREPGRPLVTPDLAEGSVEKVAEWICEIAGNGNQTQAERRSRILVLNGPNLNLLGEREPGLYGRTSYAELEDRLLQSGRELNLEILIRQSNLEGDLVSLIQQARHWADGIIINPGGYTHTSVAMRDALSAVTLPVIEVHLTDVFAREEFRRISLISPVCRRTIGGRGIDGYLEALRDLKIVIDPTATGVLPEARSVS